MTTMLAEVDKRAESLSAALAKISICQEEVASQKIAAAAKINATFNQMFDQMRDRQKEALNFVEALVLEKQKQLGAQAEAIDTFQQSIASSTSYVRRTLDSGSDAEVMLSKPILVQRLQDLTRQECALEPAASSDLHVNNDTQALLSAISSFCVTHTANAKAECCTAEGAGLCEIQLVGEPSEFVVTLRDGEGELTKCVGDMARVITVEATMVELEDAKIGNDDGAGGGDGAGACASAVVVPVAVAAGAVPAMTCTYTATHAGKLGIGVKVYGQHLPGSPFEVQTTMEPPFPYGFTNVNQDIVATSEKGNRRCTQATESRSPVVATPGISKGVVFWDIKVHQLKIDTPWMMVGVVANATPGEMSYSDGTCYAWGANDHSWIAGTAQQGYLGWPAAAWNTGDEATFKLDCQARTLSVKHRRIGKVFTIPNLPADKKWYIHVHLCGTKDSLEILPPSERF
jgi:hypothetical protein